MPTTRNISVRLNGKQRDVEADLTVRSLLESLQLHSGLVVVEVNREIVSRDRYDEVGLSEGDAIELVHFVGGG